MIAYDLQCINGHTFEGWFESAETFDQQNESGLIACPVCNEKTVSKRLSTFAIKTSSSSKNSFASSVNLARINQKIVDYVEKNFDNVGSDFTKEALKIHYGAAEPRNIRGVSTAEEEKTLKKEGVEFVKIPMPTNSEN